MLLDTRKTQVIEVEVTQEDVDKGTRIDPGSCALALALKRATGEDWFVGSWFAVRTCEEGLAAEVFNHDGTEIVTAFDRGAPILGTVRLTKPDIR